MQKFKAWFAMALNRIFVSVWVPILIITANALCTVVNIRNGADDFTLLGNAIGCAFAIGILYNYFQFKKENEALLREFAEKMRELKEIREKFIAQEQDRKSHSDESNSDKT